MAEQSGERASWDFRPNSGIVRLGKDPRLVFSELVVIPSKQLPQLWHDVTEE